MRISLYQPNLWLLIHMLKYKFDDVTIHRMSVVSGYLNVKYTICFSPTINRRTSLKGQSEYRTQFTL